MNRREQIKEAIKKGVPMVASGSTVKPETEENKDSGAPIKRHEWGLWECR